MNKLKMDESKIFINSESNKILNPAVWSVKAGIA